MAGGPQNQHRFVFGFHVWYSQICKYYEKGGINVELLNPLKPFIKALLYEIDQDCQVNGYRQVPLIFINENQLSEEMNMKKLFHSDNPYLKLIDGGTVDDIAKTIKQRIDAFWPFEGRTVESATWCYGPYQFQKVFLCWVAAVALDLMGEIAFNRPTISE